MNQENKSLLYLIIMVAVSLLFVSSNALSFSDEPCYGVNYDCGQCGRCNDPDDYTLGDFFGTGVGIRLMSITPYGDTGYYDWLYRVFGTNQKGLNFAAFLIPFCCKDPEVLIDLQNSDPIGTYAQPGEGETSLDFGRYVQQARVYKVTPDDTFPNITIRVNTDQRTYSSVLLKLKGSATSIEAIVPGCTPAPDPSGQAGGVTPSIRQCLNNYGNREIQGDEAHYVFYRLDDAEGCINPEMPFKLCTGLCPADLDNDPGTCITIPEEIAAAHVLASGLQGQRCEDEATNTSWGNSPFYLYETWSGGYYWAGCLDLNPSVYNWVDVKCCTGELNCP